MTDSSDLRPLVLVISGAGTTGVSVLQGLAKAGKWRLAASVRPKSVENPEVSTLRELGVDIKPVDWQNASAAELDELFKGTETVICTCNGAGLLDQKHLIDAAKRNGVRRFIPSDFAIPVPHGVMNLHDTKSLIHQYLKEQEVPYTIVDVGFWMQLTVPYKSDPGSHLTRMVRVFYGYGEVTTAITNKDHIGDFVARIIVDHKTLNQYVLVHEAEHSQKEIYDVCSRIAGVDFRKTSEYTTVEQLKERLANAEGLNIILEQYMHSIYVAGYNSVETARSLGGLIAQELYPDLKSQSLEEFAKEFYSK